MSPRVKAALVAAVCMTAGTAVAHGQVVAPPPTPTPIAAPAPCAGKTTQKEHRAVAVVKYNDWKHPLVSKAGKRQLARLRAGACTPAAAKNMRQLEKKLYYKIRPMPPIGTKHYCIMHHETGGTFNLRAANGQYLGFAQWSAEAWRRMKGLRFASTPLGADWRQQLTTLVYGFKHWGCNDWCRYDGC